MFTYLKKFLLAYFVLLAVFSITVILSCLIPSSSLKQNIGESLNTFKKEGIYPTSGLSLRPIVLDNFTDSMMFNIAYSVDSNRPVWSAMTNNRFVESFDQVNQITNLEKLYEGKAGQQAGYERYWHGYLVFLRPLLVIFSYSGIRNILTFALYASLIWFLFLSWKKLGKIPTVSFLLGLIAVDFFFLGQSIQFSSVFLIGLLSSIYYLITYKKNHYPYILFFIVGGLTSFFDLLTAPLVSLGILLIVTTILDRKQNIFLSCLSWLVGYFSLWFSKWLMAALLFTPGAITTAFDQIVNRTVNKADANFSQLNAVQLNLFQLIGYNRLNKIVLLFFFFVFLIFLLRYFRFKVEKITNIIPWFIIGVIPYGWYLIAANHSYLHVWFTYRNQLMSVISFFLITVEFVDWRYVKQDLRSLQIRIGSLFKFTSKYH